ncbi:MAG: antA/AntB antirepressor family protein [Chitinophagales bacterium]|nr:antA/AntB antirepressor family protein [Chitinophagales bacterium]
MPNNSLIPIINQGEESQWVDARELHKFLRIGRDFSTWIKDYVENYGFVEGRDFSPNMGKSTGGRKAIEYTITLDMAKHLAMLQRSELGMKARQYFIDAEKQLRKVNTALLSIFEEMRPILSQCQTMEYRGHIWYCASEIRRLSSKSYNHGKIKIMAKEGKARKMPVDAQGRWFVREDYVHEVLCIKPNHQKSVAIIGVLQTQKYLN